MMKISRSILIIAFLFSGLIFTITFSRTDTAVDASAGEFTTLPKQVEPSKNQIAAYLSETSEPNAIYSPTTLAADINTESWQCWDWDDGTPDPCHHLLHSIDMVTANDGWAVGFNGVILRWEETQWTKHESPTDRWLYAVDMVSANDGWIVGNGVVLRWDGIQWNEFIIPAILTDVQMLSSNNGWAVGYNSIYRWNGTAWQAVSNPTSSWLYSIDMVTATDGWAVGQNGNLVHWNGFDWSLVESPTTERLESVDMVSETEGWAVGANGTILHWDGEKWTTFESPVTVWMTSVKMISANEGWATGFAGSSVLLRWDGTSWNLVTNPIACPLFAFAAVDENDIWSVGEWGSILRWNGLEWTAVSNPTRISLMAVEMASTELGWAVGMDKYGDGQMIQWDGTEWTPVPGVNASHDIQLLSSNHGWAVGNTISHWDGVNWTPVFYPLSTLTSISILPTNQGWAVGYGGGMAYWNGTTWSDINSPTEEVLWDVDLVAANDGWAVGQAGTILHWNGSTWNEVTSPTDNTLYSVDMVSTTDGWAVGDSGTVLRWNGNDWQLVNLATSAPFYSVEMISANEGWIIGNYIYYWDGANWYSVTSQNTNPLYDVAMSSSNDGWVVGSGSSILRYVDGSRDTDGDGLFDHWEITGYDHNGDGSIDVDLPAMGANWLHKDIFLEVDYMVQDGACLFQNVCLRMEKSFRPRHLAIHDIVMAFHNAPIANPDGTTGIHLHVDYGTDSPLVWGPGANWDNLSNSDRLPYSNYIAQSTEEFSWDDHYFPRVNFAEARKYIFHYALFADKLVPFDDPNSNIAGLSLNNGDAVATEAPGQYILITPGTSYQDLSVASFLMHELGHNLQLGHGGGDSINQKPNYLSIMNYSFVESGLIINGKSGTFDFSTFDQINPLNEFDLDESMGVGSISGESLNNFSTIFYCNSQRQTALLGGSVNWNCDSTIEANVVADLNADGSTLGILESYNDWQNIVFTGGCIGTVGDCLPAIESYDQVSLAYTAETRIYEEPLPEIDMPHKILLPPDTTYVIDDSLSATIPITITNAGTEAVNVLLLYTTQSDVFNVSNLTEQIFFQPGETILVSIGLAADIETITEEYLTITATIIENSNWVNQTTIGVAKPQNGNIFLPLILKP